MLRTASKESQSFLESVRYQGRGCTSLILLLLIVLLQDCGCQLPTMPMCLCVILCAKIGAKLPTDESKANNEHSVVTPYFCMQSYLQASNAVSSSHSLFVNRLSSFA